MKFLTAAQNRCIKSMTRMAHAELLQQNSFSKTRVCSRWFDPPRFSCHHCPSCDAVATWNFWEFQSRSEHLCLMRKTWQTWPCTQKFTITLKQNNFWSLEIDTFFQVTERNSCPLQIAGAELVRSYCQPSKFVTLLQWDDVRNCFQCRLWNLNSWNRMSCI